MSDLKKELLGLVAEAYGRISKRLEGLTDEEYLWEPVDLCWTVRPDGDGNLRGDWGFIWDETPPFTTIAWRMGHLIECYGGERTATWLGLDARTNPVAHGMPGTASDAIRALEQAHDNIVAYIDEIDETELWTKIGPIGGIYADQTKLALLLHQLDEVIHHGAEVALMRDLYRAMRREDPFVVACLTPDREAVESMRREDEAIVARTMDAYPELMLRAAETGRWASLPLLVELGFPLEGRTGRGPLHHAAGAGNVDAIRVLVDAGADTAAKDPSYNETPLGWAEYFNRVEAAEYLRSLS